MSTPQLPHRTHPGPVRYLPLPLRPVLCMLHHLLLDQLKDNGKEVVFIHIDGTNGVPYSTYLANNFDVYFCHTVQPHLLA